MSEFHICVGDTEKLEYGRLKREGSLLCNSISTEKEALEQGGLRTGDEDLEGVANRGKRRRKKNDESRDCNSALIRDGSWKQLCGFRCRLHFDCAGWAEEGSILTRAGMGLGKMGNDFSNVNDPHLQCSEER